MAYTKKQIETIFNQICDEVSKGAALRTVLLRKDMPSSQTFYIWITINEDDSESVILDKENKSKHYARCCADRADAIFEECLIIADNQEDDIYENEEGKKVTNHNVINRSRLRVDTRKWMLGKMQPKKFGDKIDITSDGEKIDQTKHIHITHNGKDIDLST